jgi:hypothetical protein
MFGDDHDGPPLHIPDEALRKPKGAAIGEDGKVGCISCGERFPLSAVDIVGQGYRCAPCGHQAHVASLDRGGENVDASAHLSRGLREDLKRQATGLIAGGIALVIAGIAIIAVTVAADIGTKIGGLVIAGGVGMIVTGSMKKSAAGA